MLLVVISPRQLRGLGDTRFLDHALVTHAGHASASRKGKYICKANGIDLVGHGLKKTQIES